jgi:hypothetical protein
MIWLWLILAFVGAVAALIVKQHLELGKCPGSA